MHYFNAMAVCGNENVDIIGELEGIINTCRTDTALLFAVKDLRFYFVPIGKGLYCITDQILLSLDWKGLKAASLVSKAWREAVLVALKAISRKNNPLNLAVSLQDIKSKQIFTWIK